MEIPETPVVLNGEPRSIPIVGCKPAETIVFSVEGWENASTFAGDLLVMGLLSAKSPRATRGKEEKSPKKELAYFSPEAKEIDKKLSGGLLFNAVQQEEFEGSLGTHVSERAPRSGGTGALAHTVALGLGAADEFKPAEAAAAGAALAAVVLQPSHIKVTELGLVWPHLPDFRAAAAVGEKRDATSHAAAAGLKQRLLQALLESLLVELQPDKRFKSDSGDKEKSSQLEKITIFVEEVNDTLLQHINAARILAKSVYFAQELVNAPANFCNPVSLAHAAADMAKKVGVSVEVLQQRQLEKLKMLSYLSVNKGSLYPPQFIHLTYKPKEHGGSSGGGGRAVKRLVFVGKGVCFDSGGYNIKSAASSIELMKFDMGGAAAALAAVLALGELRPPHVEVHAVVAACENMVSEKAYRPGDIVTAANGKTIEVGNTDAEGRLTLADALVYAEKYLQPHTIVDIATLTGAVLVALGHKYSAVYSSNDNVAHQLLRSAENSGELMWHMPLVKEYAEALESKIADLQNVGTKNKAGSILAALFLEQFVQHTPWAHIDIAGTAWDTKRSRATGYGVRTLVEYALEISRQHEAPLPK